MYYFEAKDIFNKIIKKKVIRGLKNLYVEANILETALSDVDREPFNYEVSPEHQFIRQKYGFEAGTYYRYENYIFLYRLMRGPTEIDCIIELISKLYRKNKQEFDLFYEYINKSKLIYNYHKQRVNLLKLNSLIRGTDNELDEHSDLRSKLVFFLLLFENDSFFRILGFLLDLHDKNKFNQAFFSKKKYQLNDANLRKSALISDYKKMSKYLAVAKSIKLALDFELRNMIAHNDFDLREKNLVGIITKKRYRYSTIDYKLYALQGLYNAIPLALGRHDFEDKKQELASKGILSLSLCVSRKKPYTPYINIYQFWPFASLNIQYPWMKTIKVRSLKRKTFTDISDRYSGSGKIDKNWKKWKRVTANIKEVEYNLFPIIPTTGHYYPLRELNNTYESISGPVKGKLRLE